MAGFYPDVPGPRIPYDRDGTVGVRLASNGEMIASLTPAQLITLNNEDTSTGVTVGNDGSYAAFIFAVPHDIYGVAVNLHTTEWTYQGAWTSPDTTNGEDGAWTSQTTIATRGGSKRNLRENINVVMWPGVVGVRLRSTFPGGVLDSSRFNNIHFFGSPSSDVYRLQIWHPTLDQALSGSHLDWGDAPRSTSADKTFRVKNTSPTFTATGLSVVLGSLTDTTPSVPGQHLLSLNGVDFAASVAPPDLGPGAISDVITIRRNLGAGAALGLWWARVIASATSWEVV